MIVLLMGVTGAGKTTVGALLARQMGWEFADADSFHSAANVEKMRRGIALTDEDRAPWLRALHDFMAERSAASRDLVLACSALKRAYRQKLCEGLDIKLVYLHGKQEYIVERLRGRRGHYAPASLVASQFADLEEPDDDEPEEVAVVEIDHSPEEIVAEIRRRLGLA